MTTTGLEAKIAFALIAFMFGHSVCTLVKAVPLVLLLLYRNRPCPLIDIKFYTAN